MSLSSLLSQINALVKLHQFAHWKSSGSNYFSDHILFERLYNETSDLVDGVAEKSIGLFGADSIDMVENTQLTSELLTKWKSLRTEQDLPSVSLIAVKDTMEAITNLKHELGDRLTGGLQNMLDGILDKLESHIYLLTQRTTKEKTAASSDLLESPRLISGRGRGFGQGRWFRTPRRIYRTPRCRCMCDACQRANMMGDDMNAMDHYNNCGKCEISKFISEINESGDKDIDIPDDHIIEELKRLKQEREQKHENDRRVYIELPTYDDYEDEPRKDYSPKVDFEIKMDEKKAKISKRIKNAVWEEYEIMDDQISSMLELFDEFVSDVRSNKLNTADRLATILFNKIQPMQSELKKLINRDLVGMSDKFIEDVGLKLQILKNKLKSVNEYKEERHFGLGKDIKNRKPIGFQIKKKPQETEAKMILKDLFKVAYHLELKGKHTEADKIDDMIKTLVKRVGLSLEDLTATANYLDEIGMIDAANKIDGLLKEAAKKPMFWEKFKKDKKEEKPGKKDKKEKAVDKKEKPKFWEKKEKSDKPSKKAPKGWAEKTEKDLKKKNPDYSAKQLSGAVTEAWEKLTPAKQLRAIKQYDKKGKDAPKKD